ncbi:MULTISPECIES: transketolase [Enterococcus]|uniref:transketolase n=1 Tax=Enterococcus TaxID=1350 RepID=UPI000EE171E0|nr:MULTISPECIES: transketolase [Enterococcus]HCM86064.1 transketolase [Enterococcus sp.]
MTGTTIRTKELEQIANSARIDIIEMIAEAGSGHPGGSLSIIDIITVLFYDKMNIDSKNPKMENRDRLVLSKGHVAPALYATLANQGYFDKEELMKLRKAGEMLQGHPDMKSTPGIDASTGSLGQGLSIANGMALAAKLNQQNHTIYTIFGDGELQEGQVWEAAMTSAHYKLDNIIAIVDHNGLQIDGTNDEVMTVNPIDKKFEAFNWIVIKINGHDFDEISQALDEAKKVQGKPTVIIAETAKGKGVSFMENNGSWHGVAPNAEQRDAAVKELRGNE